jgi:hypothetical protein
MLSLIMLSFGYCDQVDFKISKYYEGSILNEYKI